MLKANTGWLPLKIPHELGLKLLWSNCIFTQADTIAYIEISENEDDLINYAAHIATATTRSGQSLQSNSHIFEIEFLKGEIAQWGKTTKENNNIIKKERANTNDTSDRTRKLRPGKEIKILGGKKSLQDHLKQLAPHHPVGGLSKYIMSSRER